MRRDDDAEGREDEETGRLDAAEDAAGPDAAEDARGKGTPDAAGDLPRRENVHALTVVGLGGSAGSIPALEAFFQSLPKGSGPAYVVVLHLAPDHESRLAELLGRSTTLRVSQVTGTIRMERDQVYVIPPGKQLEMRGGTLSLSALDVASGARTTIDAFFRALADAHGPQATAVVLSGTGADGTLGLRRIKEAGGLTVVQSPTEAEYDAMPRNAIATGQVDYVLPAAAMAVQIAAYWETSSRMRLPVEAAPSPEQRLEGPEPEAALGDILAHVRAQTGHDFSAYKRATVLRRIGRRLQVNGRESLPDYLNFLRSHPAETGDLVSDLLISVTQFFRDPEAWQALERDIIPRLFRDRNAPSQGVPGQGMPDEEPVRVWVCGCATGEEAYSLAILLLEQAARVDSSARLQVFATDMDAATIAAAREGVYPDTIVADVSEERLRRWFYRTAGGRYQVRKEVREIVLFASHDVLRDTPFSRMSLVTCRNLLIYLNSEAQQHVFETFHFALRPDGRLFLGASESAEATPVLFGATDKPHRFFVRRPVARPVVPAFVNSATGMTNPLFTPAPQAIERPRPSLTPLPPASAPRPIVGVGELHRSLLELYAPPSALVDERHEVLHLSDGAGQFLRVGGGEPTRDLLRMVRSELRVELRTALFMAASEGRDQVRLVHAALAEGRPAALVRLTVRPVDAPEGARGYFLVFFQELVDETALTNLPPAALTLEEAAGVSLSLAVPDLSTVPAVRQLEEENAYLQAQVRGTVERYEALTEELKASNEELQAINEELRSAAEELETSKEELQSVNEELTTVNHELKSRVDEVSRANGDLQNFLASTDIGTIFLDRALRIRRYTPAAEMLFQLIPSDLGRPLSDLTTRLDYPDLWRDAARVLERLEIGEREVATADGLRHFLARLLPYRTLDDRIDGVVVNFVDITARRSAEEAVRESEARQTFLLRLADALRPLSDPVDIVGASAQVTMNYFKADRCYYCEIKGDVVTIARDARRADLPSVANTYSLSGSPLFKLLSQAGQPIVVPDVNTSAGTDEELKQLCLSVNIRAFINVPVLKNNRLVGSFCLTQSEAREWADVETDLAREIAERTWSAAERAHAEEALRESEEKYRTLFDSIDEGFLLMEIIYDGNGKAVDLRYLEANPAIERQTGLSYLAGNLATDVVPATELPWLESVSEVARTGEPVRFENYTGDIERWYSVYASRVGGDGSRQVVCVFDDITERKHRERNLAFLTDLETRFASLTSSEEITKIAAASIGEHFGVSHCLLVDIDAQTSVARVFHDHRATAELPSLVGDYRLESFHSLAEMESLAAGRPVVINDVLEQRDPPESGENFDAIGTRALVTAPYVRQERWTFAIGVQVIQPRRWREDETNFLTELATRVALRIERARAEESLRASEERFRTLTDAIAQIIWTNNSEGAADYFNQRWYDYTGLTYEQSAGPGWQAVVHPDDAPGSVEAWQHAQAVGMAFDTENRLRGADGTYRWFIGRNVPLKDATGAVSAWFGSATDVEAWRQAQAARQESEERFRLLVEGARDYAMFLLDLNGRVTFWSAGAERILGYTEAEAIGQPSALIFTPEDRKRGEPAQEIGRALVDGQALDRRWHLRRNGERFWADGILMRLDDEAGAARGFAKVMRDATQQWQAEEEARQAMEAVAQANAELEQRVEERTVQWREAATARQDLTRRLVEAEEEERRRLSRELHDQTGQHLTGLLLGLNALRASQPDDSEPAILAERLREVAADLSRDVHQLAWDLRPPALDDIGLPQTLLSYVQEWGPRNGVAADFFAPDGDSERLAPEVETALYRVVQEALTNIARHARAGRVSVVLERRGGGTVLVVEDDGIGFDAAATQSATTRLGLRGMRERVEMVGGTLEIESNSGGTTLVINVPAATEQTATNAAENTDA